MRAVLQRVRSASVRVDGGIVGQIESGWLSLLGVCTEDELSDLDYIVDKTLNLRVFNDDNGKFNHSLMDCGGQVLVVSQFTLYADSRKGRRPSFTRAADLDKAREYYELYIERLKSKGIDVASGRFQADMKVSLENDGPVTIILDSTKIL